MSRSLWPVWLVLGLLFAAPAGACGLQVELLYTADRLDGPPAAAPVLSRVETDAASGRTVPIALPRRTTGHWLRLSCRQALDARAGWQLVVDGVRPLDALTFYPPGAPPRRVVRAGTTGPRQPARAGWALALPQGWPASSVAYLHAEGAGARPMRLRLVRTHELMRERRDALRRTQAAVAVLLAVALGMLAAQARGRDRLTLGYAGYLACIALYVLLLSNGGASPTGAAPTGVFAPLTAHGPVGPWAVATLAVALHLAFAGRALELGRRAPMAAMLVRALTWLSLGLLAALLAAPEPVQAWYGAVGSALLVVGAPLVPGLALLAWRRGSARAPWCLAGGLPLATVTALAAAHRLGLVELPGVERALPLAAAVEAVVLAFALGRHAVRRARRAPDRDALTGALNADAFERRLEARCGPGPFDMRRCCLLLLDLDDFAELNARHGREAGDAVLCKAQARLQVRLRSGDALARIGGDRFAIISECALDDSNAFARRLADALAATPFRVDRQSLVVTASIGVATARRGEPAAVLMQRAQQALQRARSLGRNAISTAEPARRTPALADL